MTFAPHMDLALQEARTAAAKGEVPVGAVVLGPSGAVIARAHNLTRHLNDPTAHAEILAIRQAADALGQERLTGCTLYVTLEPCPMCAGAISHARLARVVYGAMDAKSGGTDHGARVFNHPQCHHRPEVISGIQGADCETLLLQFFAGKR
ncbi:MAG: nucleoside deaminase [Planktomarina sp.]